MARLRGRISDIDRHGVGEIQVPNRSSGKCLRYYCDTTATDYDPRCRVDDYVSFEACRYRKNGIAYSAKNIRLQRRWRQSPSVAPKLCTKNRYRRKAKGISTRRSVRDIQPRYVHIVKSNGRTSYGSYRYARHNN